MLYSSTTGMTHMASSPDKRNAPNEIHPGQLAYISDLFQMLSREFFLSGIIRPQNIFLQLFHEITTNQLLIGGITTQLFVFIHRDAMGQQMPCRQALNFPTAQAALYELFSNRFFRLRHQISSRVFLLGRWRHIGFCFRYRILRYLNLC